MAMTSNFRIPLQKKIKKVRLPPFYIWDDVVGNSTSIETAFAVVDIINYKRLFGFKYMRRGYCVISNKGYLVMYKNLSDRVGYSFDLMTAQHLTVTEKFNSYGSVRKTKVEIKWVFGAVTLRFEHKPQMAEIFRKAYNSTYPEDVFTEEYSNELDEGASTDEEASIEDGETATKNTSVMAIKTRVEMNVETTNFVTAKSQLEIVDPLAQTCVNGDRLEIYFHVSDDQIDALRSLLAESDEISLQLGFNGSSQCKNNDDGDNDDDGSAM